MVPQLAGARGTAEARRVQLAKDPLAHLCRQHLNEVARRAVGAAAGPSPAEEEDGRGGNVVLHRSAGGVKQPEEEEE